MIEDPLEVAVIVGSTREGRFGTVVADWFVGRARRRDDVELDVIDLAEVGLPAVYPREPGPAARAYMDRIGRADGFVVITPEYNHGYPASLKQALDLPRRQWHAKPVALVSYGGRAGGARAIEQLRQVFAELHTVTVRDTVSLAMAGWAFDEDGRLEDPEGPNAAVKVMLDQLVWWARTLRDARAARPYGS